MSSSNVSIKYSFFYLFISKYSLFDSSILILIISNVITQWFLQKKKKKRIDDDKKKNKKKKSFLTNVSFIEALSVNDGKLT